MHSGVIKDTAYHKAYAATSAPRKQVFSRGPDICQKIVPQQSITFSGCDTTYYSLLPKIKII